VNTCLISATTFSTSSLWESWENLPSILRFLPWNVQSITNAMPTSVTPSSWLFKSPTSQSSELLFPATSPENQKNFQVKIPNLSPFKLWNFSLFTPSYFGKFPYLNRWSIPLFWNEKKLFLYFRTCRKISNIWFRCQAQFSTLFPEINTRTSLVQINRYVTHDDKRDQMGRKWKLVILLV